MGLLNKLLGRPSPPSPEVEAARAELDALAGQRPALAGPIAVLRAVLPALYEEPVSETAPTLDAEAASVKLAAGAPLLRGADFTPEARSFGRRWQRVCTAAGATAEAEAARAGRLDLMELARSVLAARPEEVHARADALGLDAGLTATVLRLTLYPVLARVSAALAPLRQATQWTPGYCPTCGSWPLLGEFRGLEQTRYLRCGLCAASWEFPRLRCPFCETRDHEQLGYFHVEGEEARYRAATCAACGGYVKMVTTLSALGEPHLLVADLATMHLDLAAAERGYSTP